MNLKEIKRILDELGIPVTFVQWKKNDVPNLPYLVYSLGSHYDIIADDENYVEVYDVYIDLYQDDHKYDFILEKNLKNIFKNHKLPFNMNNPIYIENEKFYQTTFVINVVEKE